VLFTLRRIRLPGHVAYMDKRNAHTILAGKPERDAKA